MRTYVGTGTYIVALVAALYAGALLNGALSHTSAATSSYFKVRSTSGEGLSTRMKTVHVKCPSGSQPVGGGAVVGYQSGTVQDPNGTLVESEPDKDNGWQASGIDRTSGDHWGVVVYAICAKF